MSVRYGGFSPETYIEKGLIKETTSGAPAAIALKRPCDNITGKKMEEDVRKPMKIWNENGCLGTNVWAVQKTS